MNNPLVTKPLVTKPPTVFISADHGLAIVYFLQSDVVATLLSAGCRVVILTDDALQEQISQRFAQPNLIIEGLRLQQAGQYASQVDPDRQWWLHYLRRVGSSNQINTQAMDSYVDQVAVEEGWKRRALMPLGRAAIFTLRRSQRARSWLRQAQLRYTPDLYGDLFERYQPSLVLASTPGWRLDRYLLRQAAARGIPTAAVVVGWDNSSSYSISGAPVQWINCWSELQKQELLRGSDWPAERVHIGGIPSYDGYLRKEWQIPRDEYFAMHGLDPARKLLAYAASFVSFAPNYPNVEALANLVAQSPSPSGLSQPSQLLIRLHPNHFMDNHLFAGERQKIMALAARLPHVHVVEPVPLGGSLGYYSGEDMPEKASMMAHADAFLTVYSTMLVEAALHDRPLISVCLDTPGGWNTPRKYSLPLTQIGNWPTHQRFREAGAGQVASTPDELCAAINRALDAASPAQAAERQLRQEFIRRECTYTDGQAGHETAEWILSLLNQLLPTTKP